jgi:glycosyltransferase involved in cell wall biosynthesis
MEREMSLSRSKERPVDVVVTVEKPLLGISVIIPVVERCDDLAEIYGVHAEVLKRMGRPFEFIFVIDHGFEDNAQKLKPLIALGEPIRIIALPRRFGEATALMVGFDQAKGETLVTLPSYFQVLPDGIEKVLMALEGKVDMALAMRYPRIDSWMNRIQTRGFHFLLRKLTGVDLNDMGCGLKAMRRRVMREVNLYGDLHRFLPLLAYQRGFRVVEIDVPQHPAESRIRVYRPGVYLRRLLDMMTLFFLFKFTKKPLRFFGLIGAGLFGSGFLISAFLAIQKMLGLTALADRPLLILGALLMVLGVQTGSIGLLGEMIIFTHARKMKDYAIDNFIK